MRKLRQMFKDYVLVKLENKEITRQAGRILLPGQEMSRRYSVEAVGPDVNPFIAVGDEVLFTGYPDVTAFEEGDDKYKVFPASQLIAVFEKE